MARHAPLRLGPNWLGPRLRLGLALIGLLFLAFIPPRWLGLTEWMAAPLRLAISPAQQKLGEVVRWVRGDAARDRLVAAASPELAELERQRNELGFRLLQAEEQIKELRRVIAEISRSSELSAGEALKMVPAAVIGGPADLTSRVLTVRAGRAQGIEPNSVAVTRGVHLVGRVRSVSDRTCTVLPINDRSHPPINGVIMLDDERRGPGCQLAPDGKGRLVGLVRADPSLRDPTTGESEPIKEGMKVRFDDTDNWPRSARMLIVGHIIAIESLPNQPLRKSVVVEPFFAPDKVSEVTLRQLVTDSPSWHTAGETGNPGAGRSP
ncbi:MAG: rod shape-determining protein MreC [Phycisphaerales bacterium]